MKLYPRTPITAVEWQRRAPFAHAARIGAIRCVVEQDGTSQYYYRNEWLQDGAILVEVERGRWVVMTKQRVEQLYIVETE
ncbi:hypothetical protein M0R72_14095 [Candidatus Pacearchaeota archaeon]|jgi:hypothetical protein|nr:hypothetical protein [Candidatus Pacearchaeota archaeon]